MNSLHNETRVRGLPRWLLLAATPLVLILGTVTGIAVSAWWPAPAVTPAPTTPSEEPDAPSAESPTPGNVAPGTQVSEPTDDPTPPGDSGPTQEVGLLPPPVDFWSYPAGEPSQAASEPVLTEVKTLVDARAVLSAEYGAFSVGGRERFRVDYQLARDKNYETMLVGIVKIADYGEWVQAVKDHPDQLNRWLRSAAQRVQPAAVSEGFTLTWAIFEVVTDQPFGFLASEVTPMPRGGGYLVTRPLAAVTDAARSIVSIASTDIGVGPQTVAGQPSNVYGPVLRFDPTDLYRPTQRP